MDRVHAKNRRRHRHGHFLRARALRGGRVVPWWISHWEFRLSFLGAELTRFVGSALILAGVSGLVDSFGRFALQGLGTPAPIAPTQHLVVTGLYRYVRNPIYVAVAAVIFGQAVLFGDWRLFAYGAVFCLVCTCLSWATRSRR